MIWLDIIEEGAWEEDWCEWWYRSQRHSRQRNRSRLPHLAAFLDPANDRSHLDRPLIVVRFHQPIKEA